jgi:hypothetical protein
MSPSHPSSNRRPADRFDLLDCLTCPVQRRRLGCAERQEAPDAKLDRNRQQRLRVPMVVDDVRCPAGVYLAG